MLSFVCNPLPSAARQAFETRDLVARLSPPPPARKVHILRLNRVIRAGEG
jgi:hypothetical protein